MTSTNVLGNKLKTYQNAMEKVKDFYMWYSNKLKAIPCVIPH
jgi:hypothetical protein